jgi:hypothetical protein
MNYCPAKFPAVDSHGLQNLVNCGKWFHHDKRQYDNHTIPAFVQPGYERLYLQKYPPVLNYTQEGYPSVRGYSTPKHKTKASGIWQQYAAGRVIRQIGGKRYGTSTRAVRRNAQPQTPLLRD